MRIIRKERKDGIDGMFWRFLATAEPEIEVVLVRDVDTRFGLRDKQANDMWLASRRDYHIVRDIGSHRDEIMGGLWSCRGEKIPHMEQLIANWKKKSFRGYDQAFLAFRVYPWIRDLAYIQSDINVFRGEDVHPCPEYTDVEDTALVCMGSQPGPYSIESIDSHNASRQKYRRTGKHVVQIPIRIRWSLMRLPHRPRLIRCIKETLVYEKPFRSIGNWLDILLLPVKYRSAQEKNTREI